MLGGAIKACSDEACTDVWAPHTLQQLRECAAWLPAWCQQGVSFMNKNILQGGVQRTHTCIHTGKARVLCSCCRCGWLQGHGKFDMKEPYYRQLNAWAQAVPQAATTQQQVNTIPGLSVTVGDVAGDTAGVLLPQGAAGVAAAAPDGNVAGVGAQSAAADMCALAM